ncbi:VCBS domain-containing protein [Vibrio sp. ZSDE26]|uniref:VCBS domain-containing protein n=1 Tax=Vibrio amylolyticus TaxID=2847292 RepID=A0A9X1XUH9_9VIBR|nr:VCBS domain-containing protein [Vibrio amylolyticus]MCK6265839.1 VCBS domain-containing protein [Vibrio amylolyticus]
MSKLIQIPVDARIVIKQNGELVLLTEGEPLQSGDIEITREEYDAMTENGLNGDLFDLDTTPDQDQQALLSLLEQGLDPTQIEEFASASGLVSSSSLSGTESIDRDGSETIAQTHFETNADSANEQNENSSLFDELAFRTSNSAPIVINETRVFLEESGTSLLGITNPYDTDSDTLTITITDIPEHGLISHLDGSAINVGDVLTLSQLSEICFHSPDDCEDGEIAGVLSYSVDDGLGAFNSIQEASVEIIVQSVNDAPIAFDDTNSLDENQVLVANLPVSTDIDGTVVSYQLSQEPVVGSVSIDSSGQYIFDATKGFDYLPESQSVEVTFTYIAIDDDGRSSEEQTVTITVVGTNDAAIITGDNQGDVVEDDELLVLQESGLLQLTDVDGEAEELFDMESVTTSEETLGSLTVDETGSWKYQVDNSLVQYLGEGETKIETFAVASVDGTEHTVTITITGVNESALISGVASGSVVEDDSLTTLVESGKLDVTDEDQNQSKFDVNSVVAASGVLGSVTIDENGVWEYTVDNDDVQYLGQGETKLETFVVSSVDGTEHTISITITGINDTALIKGESSGGVLESSSASLLSDSGTLNVDDTDQNQSVFNVDNVVKPDGALGNLTITESGEWEYTVANSLVEYLGEGEMKTELFTVSSDDGTEHVIEITITGINNTAVITGESAGTVLEGSASTLSDSGKLTVFDIDQEEAVFDVNSVTAPLNALGELTIEEDGTWQYTVLDSLVQYLGEGEIKEEIFTVQSADGTSHSITIDIVGINGAAVITGDATGAVLEDDDVTTLEDSGQLFISDEDQQQAAFDTENVTSSEGVLGSLQIDALGNWDYQVDNSLVQYLGEDETKLERFTVYSVDGTEHTIDVTITGINDTAQISGEASGDVLEDEHATTLTELGQLTISDADQNESIFNTESVAAQGSVLGSLTINELGAWEYTVNNNLVQYLAIDEEKIEQFEVQSADGTTHNIVITIKGTNDSPEISGVLTGEAKEETALQVTGELQVSDVDNNAAHSWSLVGSSDSVYGSISIDHVGQWTYDLDNDAAQNLAADDTVTETFTVKVDDGLGGVDLQTVMITIKGTNDLPVITGDSSGQATEDVVSTVDGTLSVADIDINDDHSWSIQGNGEGQYGSITINQSGDWEYMVNPSKVQWFEHDELYNEETFTAVVNDGNGGTHSFDINIDILGQNDAPSISGSWKKSLVEDAGNKTRSGTLSTGDPDENENHTWTITTDPIGEHGTLTLSSTGVWTYTIDTTDEQADNTQALSLNQSVREEFYVQVTDKHGESDTQKIMVTIHGRNDEPEIAGVIVGAVTEDSAAVVSTTGQLEHSDVDANDEHAWEIQITQGQFGVIEVDEHGEWTYTLQNDHATVQALLPNETLTETFVVKVTDDTYDNRASNNASDTETITITISGDNDLPTIAGATTGSVIEATPEKSTTTGTLLALDIDANDSHTWEVVGEDQTGYGDGTYGVLSINDDGQWSYELDSTRLSTLSIPPGTTEVDSFQVKVTDSVGAEEYITVNISVAGVNTDPDIELGVTPTVVEDNVPNTISGTFGSGDPDIGDNISWSIVSLPSYGDFSLDNSLENKGEWQYQLNNGNQAVNALDEGDNLVDSVEIRVVDQFGKVSIKEFIINIEGNNDSPSISGHVAKTIYEDTASFTGQLQHGDPDADDTHTWSQSNVIGEYGNLELSSTGSWVFELNNHLEEIQQLNPEQTLTETFTVQVEDSLGELDSRDVVITIKGTNDLPIVSGVSEGTYVEGQEAHSLVEGFLLEQWLDLSLPSNSGNGVAPNTVELTIESAGTPDISEIVQIPDLNTQYSPEITNVSSQLTGLVYLIGGESYVFSGVADDSFRLEIGGETLVSETWGNIGGAGYTSAAYIPTESGWYTMTAFHDNEAGPGSATFNVAVGSAATIEMNTTNFEIVPDVSYLDGKVDFDPLVEHASNEGGYYPAESPSLTDIDDVAGTLILTDIDNDDDPSFIELDYAGNLGDLSIADSGEWVFEPSSELIDSLQDGDVHTEVFTVIAVDEFYGVVTQSITINVEGTEDNPYVPSESFDDFDDVVLVDTVLDELTVKEDVDDQDSDNTDSLYTASGTLAIPMGLGTSATWVLVEGFGQYGDISLDRDGNWEYTLDNSSSAVQSLQKNEEAQDVFTLYVVDKNGKTVVDSDGAPQLLEIVVNVQGTEDAPNITGSLVEETNANNTATISGVLAPGDIDSNDTHTWQAVSQSGNYGVFSLNADGTWTYDLDETIAELAELNGRDSTPLEETFTVKVVDMFNLESEKEVVVTINGVNEAPTLSGVHVASVSEDNQLSQTLQLIGSDVDSGDTVTFQAKSLNGTYGLFIIDALGEWSYTIYNDEPHLQALYDGEEVTESFTVYASDDLGAEASQVITVTVTGTNDVPVLSGDTQGVVEEAQASSTTGQLAADDTDIGDTVTYGVADVGDYGVLTIDSDWGWTYVVDNTHPMVNAIGVGETLTDTILVNATDSNNGVSDNVAITIVINGTNDLPTVSLVDSDILGSIDADSATTNASGTLVADDLDVTDTHTFYLSGNNQSQTGSFGEFTLDANSGEWEYQLETEAGLLLKDEVVTETFSVFVEDDNGGIGTQIITVNIQGTDDSPVITGTVEGQVKEDFNNEVSGTVSASDTETDTSSLTWQVLGSTTGQYGSLSFNTATGAWLYSLTAGSTNSLASDTNDVDEFIVEVSDGVNTTQETISITVIGNHLEQGNSGYDTLNATSEDEWLWGGPINLSDANQKDTFVWSSATVGTSQEPGVDYIKDFDAQADVLDFSSFVNAGDVWDSSNMAERVTFNELNGDVNVELSDINGELVQTVILQGVTLNDFAQIDTSLLSQQEILSHLMTEQRVVISEQYGHEGRDTLSGTSNSETLMGGADEDLFYLMEDQSGTALNPVTKTIDDFNVTQDTIDLSDLLTDSPSMAELLANIEVNVVDDELDPSDATSTTLSVTDQAGGQTDVVINNLGWNELGIIDVANATEETVISALVDQLKCVNVGE